MTILTAPATSGGLPALVRPRRGAETLPAHVAADLREFFRAPRTWLGGLGLNLALSLLYLMVAPLTELPHRDWAILVGSYFAVFLLADGTTTNALGADAQRVQQRLGRGVPLRRILLTKNVVLFLVVGVPTLIATAVITLQTEDTHRLALTLPAVLVPVLTWLGLGNLMSVAFPVASVPLRQRWTQRRDLRSTLRWLVALALPYALCSAIDPMSRLPLLALRLLGVARDVNLVYPAAVLTVSGLLMYAVATSAALVLARKRVVRFDPRP
ncbi:MAG TPA: hypothetical protein VIT20_08020 [Propionibacteriaceae bacterium]